ncbi:MAG: PEP-CTERM sorting domain-containing protein [Gammaproteobacteria bacterium]|nr:PEP-CTERM sorting domain-containing protein [Rhodocyclaceae bacterium]MBU3909949.1 PEP-CTERM sorting domain-containing protein [Gammaproteobacteria bacterium]MBU3987891.1 PEP-CTERM sorting domain-containing protein [Gammaproteobacteria bacterium]MBU4003922.1 PEP-CTERM sorting domain-containing protein [Gammaproteobacteria bacterium]MBU4020169.1 PEP-CTERM sorting domain-containing protein [Gammaproteobacteria bacterium]
MKRLIATVLLIAASATVNASITYDINRTIGAGTVTGFIETDGTLGVLGIANITDFTLTLNSPNLYGGSPQVIDFALSTHTAMWGTALQATGSSLVFDFSVPGSGFILQDTSTNPVPWWYLDSDGNYYSPQPGESIGWGPSGTGHAEFVDYQGQTITIATNVTGGQIPEPATLVLFGLSLACLGAMRWKQKAT